MAYRFYVADSLQLSAQKRYLTKSLRDIIYKKPADNRTGDEILQDVFKRAGLSFGG